MQLIVLGMHRSGTSVLARVLNMMGAYFGPEGSSTGANQENPQGFWERRDVRELNDFVLNSVGCDWNIISHFDVKTLPEATTSQFKERASKIILELDSHRPWLLKEPRLCLLFELWNEVLEIPVAIHIYRNPVEVAHSLHTRNGIPIHSGIALWEKYNLTALEATNGLPRFAVSHNKLIEDPVSEVNYIYEQLKNCGVDGLHLPSEKEITAFIRKELYHEKSNKKELSNLLSPNQITIFNEFTSNSILNRQSNIELSQSCISTLEQYDQNEKRANDLAQQLNQKGQSTKKDLDATAKKETDLKQQIDPQKENLKQQLEQKEQELNQSNQILESTKQSLTQKEQELNKSNQTLESTNLSLSKKKQELIQSNQILESTKLGLRKKEQELNKSNQTLESTNLSLSKKKQELNTSNQRIESLQDELVLIYTRKKWNIPNSLRKIQNLRYLICQKIIKKSEFFDVKFYLLNNPDVRKSGTDPVIHYIKYGAIEGRKPNKEFDTTWYLDEYPDVYNSNMNPLVHYIKYGANEGRQINNDVHIHHAHKANKKIAPIRRKNQRVLLNAKYTVDIILPVYNALEDVKKCINSLYKEKTYDFNLIVIDDCSDKPTNNYLKQESEKKDFLLLRNRKNQRFTKSVNKGFANAKGDYVILLNSDTIITAGWIEKLLRCFESDNSIGIVGPLSNAASWQTVPVRNNKESGGWMVNEIPHGYSIEAMGKLVETISLRVYPKVPSVNGFCYAIKRTVLDTNGVLDEEYFPTGYGEEDDFSIRAQQAGFSIAVADDTYIYHSKSKSYTHEIREVLTKGGRKSLDKKHGASRIKQLINDWKTEPELPKIAKHIESYIQKSTKNKKIVYTAIFGNYDSINEPEYVNEDWDYICFTDNKNFKSDVFTVKYVSPVFDNITKNARMVKILSHLFLIDYKYSLWVDGNVKIRGRNINELVTNNKGNEYITLHQHYKRLCIYDEAIACINARKDNKNKILSQINSYKEAGMPEKLGLVETAEILRQQLNPITADLNEAWWEEINKFTIRDQLAFNFVCWRYGFNYKMLEGHQWLDPYFNIYKHGTKKATEEYPATAIVIIQGDDNSPVDKRISHLIEKTNYENYRIVLVLSSNNNEQAITAIARYNNVSYIEMEAALTIIEKRNRVAENIEEKYICFLDEKIELIENNWLTLLMDEMLHNDLVVATGPAILSPRYTMQSMSIRVKKLNNFFHEASAYTRINGTGNVLAIDSACILLDRKVFSFLGMFSGLYNSKIATLDLCFKILEYNHFSRFVLNSQVIDHSKPSTLEQQRIDSHQLQKAWKEKAIFKQDIHKLERKKKLKVAYFPVRLRNSMFIAGSGYIRTVIPFSKFLSEDNIDFEEYIDLSSVDFTKINIILIQRTALKTNDITALLCKCEKYKVKLIYEIDDDLIANFKNTKNKLKEDSVRLMLTAADRVIVSTFNLKERYSKYNNNITVIENSLDLSLWKVNRQPLDTKVRCLYMGTKTHKNDLALIKNDIYKLKNEFSEFSLDIIGVADDGYTSQIGNVIHIPTNLTHNYEDFVKWINSNNQWHIGIAPLENTFFNNTKSHIKYLDYSAMGLATICSDVGAYNKTIENGVDGILVDNKEGEWYKAIKKLMLEKNEINKLRDNAYKKLTEQYDISNYKKKWLDIFTDILNS